MGRRDTGGARRYVDELIRAAIARHRPICLDSSVLIAYISNEDPAASLVAPMLEHADVSILLSAITLSEVVTRLARHRDQERIEMLQAAIVAVPRLYIVNFDQSHAIETAFVRGETRLKLPDAAIIATARLGNASAVIGNDRQWRNKPLGVPYHHMDDILALA